jgi:hypothetical protein
VAWHGVAHSGVPMVAIAVTPGEESNAGAAASTATDATTATDPSTAMELADVLWRFSRPHTTMGTTISVISISLLALQSSADLTAVAFVGLAQVGERRPRPTAPPACGVTHR